MSQDGGISDIEAEIDQIEVESASPTFVKPTQPLFQDPSPPTDLPSLTQQQEANKNIQPETNDDDATDNDITNDNKDKEKSPSHKRPLEQKEPDKEHPSPPIMIAPTAGTDAAPVQIKNKKPRFKAPVPAADASQAKPSSSLEADGVPKQQQQVLARPAFKAAQKKQSDENKDKDNADDDVNNKDEGELGPSNIINNKKNTTTTTTAPSSSSPSVLKPKTARTTFMQENRLQFKNNNPTKPAKEVEKMLAETWKQLSKDEKKEYGTKAAAEKKRYQDECKKAGRPVTTTIPKSASKENKENDEEKKEPTTKTKDQKKSAISSNKKNNNKGGASDDDEEEEKDEDEEAQLDGDGIAKSGTSSDSQRHHEKTRRGAAAAATAGGGGDNEGDHDDDGGKEEEEGDIITAAEWKAHPADFIISESSDRKKYLVARQGLALSEAVIVDAQKAKLARLQPITPAAAAANDDYDDEKPSPVSLDMITEHEASTKHFWQAVADCKDTSNELDLEQVGQGHPLELCALLGMLRYDGFDLDKPKKGDFMMKVPLLATCKVVQRLVDACRKEMEEWKDRAERAETALQQQ
jgi:hypothetical protein